MEFADLLYKIFLKDGGWLTILNGLWVTVQISALSLLLGTVLGSLLCFFRLGKIKPLKIVAQVYISIIRGSPVLMLLMLLFYGVFARQGLSPILVAVITFSMHTAAHVAELLRSALMALDKGQVEAARTLGFSKWQAFKLVTFPQLVRIAKPVYQSTVVNLIQWTSVVGYVTITDLTRVINNIASRTMQPMITIIGGMIIYLALSYLVYGIFHWTDRRRTP
ncbi:MAG: amino acid ABC transporter permease [Selenomonadaceae bacterium]|nr:amino acid ABC transporter permease [Selenomonadaceae bacterium]MBQ6758961.1 amino acid ABC transporter permease [Selenomonadaceae bacterium]